MKVAPTTTLTERENSPFGKKIAVDVCAGAGAGEGGSGSNNR